MTDNNNNNQFWRTDGNNADADDWLGTRNNQPLRIRTNNAQTMTITTAGEVGIGISAPNRTLHVQPSEVHTGGNGAGYSFGNRETATFVETPANGERWVWYATQNQARLWSGTDKVFVTTAGNVRITGTLQQGSDARVKTNIAKLTDVLSKLEAINGVSFEPIQLGAPTARAERRRDIGVIAQEVETVFPELVSVHGHENNKAVNYSGLTGVLIEAVKELKAQNEVLRSRIEAVERA
jgi:hypothetical protein